MQPSAAARFALTILLGLIGAFLWVLPTAQAESVRGRSSVTGMVASAAPAQAPLPDTPLTVAANGPIRLTIGAADPAPSGMTTVGSGKGPNCTGPVGETSTVVVPLGKSTLVNLGEPVRQRTVGNPSIVQTMLVSPQTLYLLGSDIGTTNMIVQGKGGSCSVIDVVVGADPAGLQQTIVKLMPNERGVQVTAAGDALVLTGTVTDATVAERIIELAHAFTLRPNAALPPPTAHGGPLGIAGAAPAPAAGANGGDRSQRVINMMHIAAPQQVMLEVKVAEVSKTLIDQLGAQANLQGSIGTWSFGLLAQFLSGGLGIAAAAKSNNLPLNLAIDAQKTDQLVKILAEPNLMAISGQEASFLAGGKVFIPVPQSNGTGGTTITLQEELFGVGLTFTPTVLENGRINLKVAPEVSELSPTGVAVTAGGVNSTAILPLITTRRATTTLQVYDGQSFAIGGLMKSNVTGTLKALPGIGEVPVLGALFRSTNFQEDKTELVFVVTPRLAKPLPRNYPLPTDTFANVDEAKVYATGNMEGTRPAAPAVPASAAPAATPVAAPGAAVPVPVAPQRPASPAAVGSAVPPLNLEVVPVAVPVPSAAPTPRTEPAADQAGSSTISSAPSAARQAASVGLRTEPVLAMRGAMDPQPPHSPGAHASPAEIAIQNGAASELGKDRQPASPATP
ncbi:MAG TPA: pilus assembly protein N-terminal domain-containing protein [Paraburkholderia sp.]